MKRAEYETACTAKGIQAVSDAAWERWDYYAAGGSKEDRELHWTRQQSFFGEQHESEAKAETKVEPKAVVAEEMVKCSCGCTVARSEVMYASMGTSCPDCYDSMSD